MFVSIHRTLTAFALLFCVSGPALCEANVKGVEDSLGRLAQTAQWHNLIHFRARMMGLSHRSQADDAGFMVSAAGFSDPRAELEAFFQGLSGDIGRATALRCQFPARYEWLSQAMPEAIPVIPESQCPALDAWVKQLNPRSVTLVFAASYLNSPSSMFGHTFLRLDPPDLDPQNLILANTISYAADAQATDNELMFAFRGIFGGYPGITTVEPYYQKLKLYSDMENRDLWEYELNLTPEEVHLLIRAAWEIKDKRFDYYFFDENCAYRILALIDIARPQAALIDALPAQRAIPSDTVRIAVRKKLVSRIHYRPSAASAVTYQIGQLSEAQVGALQMIMANPDSQTFLTPDFWMPFQLDAAQTAQVLEVAYDLVRYRVMDDNLPRDPYAAQSFNLLKARSQYPSQVTLPPMPWPERDDTGHLPFRLSAKGGERGGQAYAELEVRPAYHHLTDPVQGYRAGSHLEFMATAFRWYPQEDELQLERLKFVEIFSLTPRSRFFKPVSWHVGGGARRSYEGRPRRVLTPYVEGGSGLSWGHGNHLVTAMVKAQAEVSSHLSTGGYAEVGPQLHWLYLRGPLRAHLVGEGLYDFLGQDASRRELTGSLHYQVSASLSLGLSATHAISHDEAQNDVALVVQGFF